MEWYCTMPSPVGELLFLATERGLSGLFMNTRVHPPADRERALAPERFSDATRQVTEYFAGTRRDFSLALDLQGTPFQIRVWQELQRIPYGTTISYGELAERLGNPAAVRAVGAANGRNPVSIIVPCHRVIGSNGSLVGYGGGLSRKQILLQHEASQRSLF
jgi:methylated-DNA-[protein]-cysteine S-methyltransferase